MDWNLKGKGRAPYKDDQAASDDGVKQFVLQEEPGNGNTDFTDHQWKNDHRNPGDIPSVKIDKVIGRYASQSGVDNYLNEPDENQKSPADGNVKDVKECQHVAGLKHILVVRGDGGPLLSKLDLKEIGGEKSVATFIDLMLCIHRACSGRFITAAAFNPYRPLYIDLERMKQKIVAGAAYAVTQLIIGRDAGADELSSVDIPMVVEAWMSTKIDPLNSMFSFNRPWSEVLPRLPSSDAKKVGK